MNNRIRELAEQAEVWDTGGDIDKCEVDLEKFAELIVRECALIAKTAEPWRSDDLILKHFGMDDGKL